MQLPVELQQEWWNPRALMDSMLLDATSRLNDWRQQTDTARMLVPLAPLKWQMEAPGQLQAFDIPTVPPV